MRIGIDLGGTKIEAIALDDGGAERARRRVPSPAADYGATVEAIRALVTAIEAELGVGRGGASVGVGMPGAVSPATGLVKNANSTHLNGRPFVRDLSRALGREVRAANDANCFALSEATDGAAAGRRLVFGVILGTGVGGGIVHAGELWEGPNAIAGEWGHLEMPSRLDDALPDTACWCGRRRCIETYLSGPGFAADHARSAPSWSPSSTSSSPPSSSSSSPSSSSSSPSSSPAMAADGHAVAALAAAGNPAAQATLARYQARLAGALAGVVGLLDPDVIVLGGGMSNIAGLAEAVAARLPAHVFSDRCTTEVVRHRHGDASGVRGAAWLWPAGAERSV